MLRNADVTLFGDPKRPWLSAMDAILLFYLAHNSHRVSVQGNEVCSGVQQSPEVGRTTVPAFAGIGDLPLSDLPLMLGLRSVSKLT